MVDGSEYWASDPRSWLWQREGVPSRPGPRRVQPVHLNRAHQMSGAQFNFFLYWVVGSFSPQKLGFVHPQPRAGFFASKRSKSLSFLKKLKQSTGFRKPKNASISHTHRNHRIRSYCTHMKKKMMMMATYSARLHLINQDSRHLNLNQVGVLLLFFPVTRNQKASIKFYHFLVHFLTQTHTIG